MHSSGDWLAPWAGIIDVLKTAGTPLSRSSPNTRSTTQPGQHGRYKVRSPFMQDKHCDDILEATKSFSSIGRFSSGPVHSSRPAVSPWAHPPPVTAHARPRHWPHRHCRVRFPHGRVRTNTDPWYLASSTIFEIYDTNWKSAEEDPDAVSRLIQGDIDAKFCSRVPCR